MPMRSPQDYLTLQLSGDAPRTQAEHEAYARWKAHDPTVWMTRAAELREALYELAASWRAEAGLPGSAEVALRGCANEVEAMVVRWALREDK